MELNTEQTVREIAIENPGSVRVFESLGIDYCCGGKRSLRDACQRANVPLEHAMHLLEADRDQPSTEPQNWAHASAANLTQHIVQQHHGYIRRESPRLIAMLDKVVSRHGTAHQELKPLQDLFLALIDELFVHMTKEENVLFPYLVKMEAGVNEMSGSVAVPINRLLADHDDAGELTARIRDLARDFRIPEGACTTYRALYRGLEEFERDLHEHVHLENNILFPHALEMERQTSAYAG